MNSEVIQEIRNAAKSQPGTKEVIPQELSRVIIPTIEVNPKLTKNAITRRYVCEDATSQTMISSPSNQDYYITSVQLSVIKDATSTSTGSSISIVQDGLTTYLLSIPSITLTAQSETISASFPHPVKMDRGTSMTLTNSTAVAKIKTTATVQFFIDETSNA